MSIARKIEECIASYRKKKSERLPGEFGRFFRELGQNKLTIGLPVQSEGIILDVGGFQGDWTIDMIIRYGCQSVIYEPMPQFVHALNDRFYLNRRVKIIEAALGGQSGVVSLSVQENASSQYGHSSTAQLISVKMVSALCEFDRLSLLVVDCMKINIEGAEYDLLESMIKDNITTRVRCFVIQFHLISEDCTDRRKEIVTGLSKTHVQVFNYLFVWERWDLK